MKNAEKYHKIHNNAYVVPATDQTWSITECRNKEGFFLEITEVSSEVSMNYIDFQKYAEILDSGHQFQYNNPK